VENTSTAAVAEEQDYLHDDDKEDMMRHLDMVDQKVDGNHDEL